MLCLSSFDNSTLFFKIISYASNTCKTTINLDKDMKKELKKIAIDEDTSLSALILKMIEESMENRK